jgi:hypothetical protein
MHGIQLAMHVDMALVQFADKRIAQFYFVVVDPLRKLVVISLEIIFLFMVALQNNYLPLTKNSKNC